MALSGAWKDQSQVQAMPNKWGTGAHPIHAVRTMGNGRPSLTAKLIAPNYGARLGDIIPIEETDSYSYDGADGEAAPWMGTGYNVENVDGWTPDSDLAEAVWGYTDDTGLMDRPRMDATTSEFRGDTGLFRNDRGGQWPALDESGDHIRSVSHGSEVSKRSKEQPTETVSEGWENKVVGDVNDPDLPDPSQLTRQTSMQQRDKTRAGSQSSGTADEHDTPIHSRITGMRVKVFSGGQRHYDMFPRQAEQHVRGWWSRTAGVAPAEWMQANEQSLRTPFTRNVPPDPHTGAEVPAQSADSNYGYVGEDVLPYV